MHHMTMTSKGQVTLPKDIRDHFHLESGDKLSVQINEDNEMVIKPRRVSIKSLKTVLSKPSKSFSLEQLNQIIAKQGRK